MIDCPCPRCAVYGPKRTPLSLGEARRRAQKIVDDAVAAMSAEERTAYFRGVDALRAALLPSERPAPFLPTICTTEDPR